MNPTARSSVNLALASAAFSAIGAVYRDPSGSATRDAYQLKSSTSERRHCASVKREPPQSEWSRAEPPSDFDTDSPMKVLKNGSY
jgi:hypothetical protein